MLDAKTILFVALGLVAAVFIVAWVRSARGGRTPTPRGPARSDWRSAS